MPTAKIVREAVEREADHEARVISRWSPRKITNKQNVGPKNRYGMRYPTCHPVKSPAAAGARIDEALILAARTIRHRPTSRIGHINSRTREYAPAHQSRTL